MAHDDAKLAELVRQMLLELGEDPEREGLLKTPDRVARALRFLNSGHETDPGEIIRGALFEEDYDEMVLVKDIELYSLCEHHMLPFHGRAHVGYIPKGKIVGLSKIPRIVEVFSRRLQVQERLTEQIAETLWEHLKLLRHHLHHARLLPRGPRHPERVPRPDPPQARLTAGCRRGRTRARGASGGPAPGN